ncbi:hypothetical protein [Serratia nevei]|uniref:hypothetical protein n=1 Tax=Serratia nevei TaxID=2703794 RepID=UPI00313BF422
MADTASLVARVKTEGAKQAADELNNVAGAANNADAAVQKIPKDANAAGQALNNAARGGMSNFRNGAQQVGFQVQDMVVQIQGGTSAFVAFGQQASQLAGAFGPGGAVLGAVIALSSAVGGALYKSLTETTVNTQALEGANKALSAAFQTSKSGAVELSDQLVQTAQSNRALFDEQVKLISLQSEIAKTGAIEALKEQDKAVGSMTGNVADAVKWFGAAKDAGATFGATLDDTTTSAKNQEVLFGRMGQSLQSVADQFGVTKEQVYAVVQASDEFNRQPTAENATKKASALAAMASSAKDGKTELVGQAQAAADNAKALSQSEQQTRALDSAQGKLGGTMNSTTQKMRDQAEVTVGLLEARNKGVLAEAKYTAEVEKRAFAEKNANNPDLIARFNAARDEVYKQDVKAFNDAQAKKAEREAAAGQKRIDTQARQAETAAARQKKAADAFLAQVDRTSGDEIARITATEQQKLEQLNAFNQQGLIVGQQFEQAKTDIQLAAEDARQKELEKRRNTKARQQNEHDQFIANIQALNATEIEMIDAQNEAKLAKAKEMHDKGRISEKEYQDSIRAIQENTEKKKEEVQLAALGDMTSNLKTALGEGNALYKAAAITQTIIDTYKGATAAYSAFAGIPIVGPALGAAAAGAAIAAGLARVSAIRSAREQGGNLAPGQVSTIAERGKPEVIMPAGASRVRTAQQMRQIMGENPGGSGGDSNIVIVNQTTGRIDSVQQDRDDEGRLRVIIRELVSGDLQDSNSDISKSRRSTRGQPGH